MGIQVQLNFPLDALKIVQAVANRPCEVRFWHEGSHRVQACTQANQCLTCRARKANREIKVLETYLK